MVLGVRDTSLGRYTVELYYKLSVTFFQSVFCLINMSCLALCLQWTTSPTNFWKQRSQTGELRGSSGPSERDSVLLWCCGATYKSKNTDEEDSSVHIVHAMVLLYSVFIIVFRDINKAVKSQGVESAKAEERLLNMDFVTAKAKELDNRRQRAEVCCSVAPIVAAWGRLKGNISFFQHGSSFLIFIYLWVAAALSLMGTACRQSTSTEMYVAAVFVSGVCWLWTEWFNSCSRWSKYYPTIKIFICVRILFHNDVWQ